MNAPCSTRPRSAFKDVALNAAEDDHRDCYVALSVRGEELQQLWLEIDDNNAKTLVLLAQAVQDSALFDEDYRPWPRCPRHPLSQHSLMPRALGGHAYWACPESDQLVTLIGSLSSAY